MNAGQAAGKVQLLFATPVVHATLDNTAEIKRVRRQIARINTLIRQREIAAAESTS